MGSDLEASIESLRNTQAKLEKVFPNYIFHIRFPRFKNIADGTKIDFSFPITALVGTNGSGKTSVLNALYGAPIRYSTGEFWFSTEVDPIVEGAGSPSRFIYGHYNAATKQIVETRKARVKKTRNGKPDPNYWEPTKETVGDGMEVPTNLDPDKKTPGRSPSSDRWNPVSRDVVYINFRKELSAFDKFFYFGREPQLKRLNSKQDLIQRDAGYLKKLIDAGDTTVELRGQKIALENRLLDQTELKAVSRILGRDYVSARFIRHNLFRGEDGVSVLFKTAHAEYSEAFAGSGEVAVTSCVVQVLRAAVGSLLLLDEPEVSLHPGAQERLLAFLASEVLRKKIQVIFSTHSTAMIGALPDDAIKVFTQLDNGTFTVIPRSHPYAAFRRLGAKEGGHIRVIVEDRLAAYVVKLALLSLNTDERELFEVDFVPGGADSILTYRIPVLMDAGENVLILLDGDKKLVTDFTDPDQIPVAENPTLGELIRNQLGATPTVLPNGGTGGGDETQRAELNRRILSWIRTHLKYLPLSCPEEIVLKAAGQMNASTAGKSKKSKEALFQSAKAIKGDSISSKDVDEYGWVLLGQNRNQSEELKHIVETLKNFLQTVKPKT